MAYPSADGVVIGHFTAVQLKQLGLSNLKPALRLHINAEEDEPALAMMRHGAHWWSSWGLYGFYREHLARMLCAFHFSPWINVSYPSSGNGVLVSWCTYSPKIGWGLATVLPSRI
ncbi:hypothetical protein F5Y09DRAFT_310748 [Xylaria sp. FL1042]|nr:hypothetical protein F5Y09DRAFT_310748 [Xylaria sp. FL1042]